MRRLLGHLTTIPLAFLSPGEWQVDPPLIPLYLGQEGPPYLAVVEVPPSAPPGVYRVCKGAECREVRVEARRDLQVLLPPRVAGDRLPLRVENQGNLRERVGIRADPASEVRVVPFEVELGPGERQELLLPLLGQGRLLLWVGGQLRTVQVVPSPLSPPSLTLRGEGQASVGPYGVRPGLRLWTEVYGVRTEAKWNPELLEVGLRGPLGQGEVYELGFRSSGEVYGGYEERGNRYRFRLSEASLELSGSLSLPGMGLTFGAALPLREGASFRVEGGVAGRGYSLALAYPPRLMASWHTPLGPWLEVRGGEAEWSLGLSEGPFNLILVLPKDRPPGFRGSLQDQKGWSLWVDSLDPTLALGYTWGPFSLRLDLREKGPGLLGGVRFGESFLYAALRGEGTTLWAVWQGWLPLAPLDAKARVSLLYTPRETRLEGSLLLPFTLTLPIPDPGYGTLRLRVDPPLEGLRLTLGEEVIPASGELRLYLPQGSHALRLSGPGILPLVERVEVKGGEEKEIILRPVRLAQLLLRCEGGEVQIGSGRYPCGASLTLPPGRYRVVPLPRPGLRPGEALEVELLPGAKAVVEPSWTPLPQEEARPKRLLSLGLLDLEENPLPRPAPGEWVRVGGIEGEGLVQLYRNGELVYQGPASEPFPIPREEGAYRLVFQGEKGIGEISFQPDPTRTLFPIFLDPPRPRPGERLRLLLKPRIPWERVKAVFLEDAPLERAEEGFRGEVAIPGDLPPLALYRLVLRVVYEDGEERIEVRVRLGR